MTTIFVPISTRSPRGHGRRRELRGRASCRASRRGAGRTVENTAGRRAVRVVQSVRCLVGTGSYRAVRAVPAVHRSRPRRPSLTTAIGCKAGHSAAPGPADGQLHAVRDGVLIGPPPARADHAHVGLWPASGRIRSATTSALQRTIDLAPRAVWRARCTVSDPVAQRTIHRPSPDGCS